MLLLSWPALHTGDLPQSMGPPAATGRTPLSAAAGVSTPRRGDDGDALIGLEVEQIGVA
jgi:hypothetical protein